MAILTRMGRTNPHFSPTRYEPPGERNKWSQLIKINIITERSKTATTTLLIPIGAEASNTGGSRWLFVRGFMWKWTRCLRLGLGDARPQPVAVRLVWLIPLWSTAPGRHGETQGAALYCREHQYRSRNAYSPDCLVQQHVQMPPVDTTMLAR